jgi:hypothetical protein
MSDGRAERAALGLVVWLAAVVTVGAACGGGSSTQPPHDQGVSTDVVRTNGDGGTGRDGATHQDAGIPVGSASGTAINSAGLRSTSQHFVLFHSMGQSTPLGNGNSSTSGRYLNASGILGGH